MNITLSAICAGLLFGSFGIFFFRQGRKESHLPSTLWGIALILYPYFIDNDYWLWGLGFVMLFLAFRMR